MKRWIVLLLLAAPAVRAQAVETTIKGGRMELINQGEVIVFRGNVHLNRGEDTLVADEMRTTQNRDSVTAIGNVRLFRRMSSTETVTATGQRGYYETKTGVGYLEGNKTQARVIHTAVLSATATRTMEIIADRIDFERQGQNAFAQGNVRGGGVDPATSDRYDFTSPQARYQGSVRLITLDRGAAPGAAQPKIIQWSGRNHRTVEGDLITYQMDRRKLVSKGKARAVVREADAAAKIR